jgi:hypothetical protein
MAKGPLHRSAWQLRKDLAWARGLLWFARAGRGGEPKRDVHLFLADRYGRLADHYAERGATGRAKRLDSKSQWHYRAARSDEPPQGAARTVPAPRDKPAGVVADRASDGNDMA